MARKKDESMTEKPGRGGGRRAGGMEAGDSPEAMAAPGRGGARQASPSRGAARADDGTGRRGGRSSTSRSRNRFTGQDLRRDLREFASARPQGWSHDDWLHFLENLKERGHNINDREAIGLALERERLDLRLEDIRGIGPRRRQALVERFGNVWSLRDADPQEIASAAGMPVNLANQVKESVA